ncbi:OmpA family protein [Desulfobacterales bacterium HSG16]|nr:OmpA family protein [Desulfobacterales bacterium HSG16]
MRFLITIALLLIPLMVYGTDDCTRATDIVIQAFDLGQTPQPQVREKKKAMLKQALALCPNHSEARNNLASIFEMEAQYDQALSHYQAAVLAKPGFAIAWFGLGEIYSKTNRFPLALEAYLNACHENSDARNRILNLLDNNRFRVSEAGEIMDKESLLLLFDKKRRENITKMISGCGFRASVVPEITFRNLQFNVGSAKIQDESILQLEEIGSALKEIGGKIKISGHTDKQPFKKHSREESVQLNMELASDRAKTIADYLVRLGVSRYRIESKGIGSKQPVAYGDSSEDYAKNRRVVIKVTE